jgi:hypothetical protein
MPRRRGALRRALEALGQTGPALASAAASIPPAHPRFVRGPRFTLPAQREQMLEFLAAEGYAVVAGALTDSEVAEALEHTWSFIEGAGTGVDRCDATTWGDDRWPLGAGSSPFASPQRPTTPELGQSPQNWYVRGCSGVKEAWATIHQTDDLITSFDGMSIYRPWTGQAHEQAAAWRTDGPWYHTDQPPFAPPERPAGAHPVGFWREYVQGFVNLVDNSELTGGNCVIPFSHTGYEAAANEHWTEEQGLSRPWEGEVLGEGVIAECRAGDLFLWCASRGGRRAGQPRAGLTTRVLIATQGQPHSAWQLARPAGDRPDRRRCPSAAVAAGGAGCGTAAALPRLRLRLHGPAEHGERDGAAAAARAPRGWGRDWRVVRAYGAVGRRTVGGDAGEGAR